MISFGHDIMTHLNALELTQTLVRYPSVTPATAGIFDYVQDLLKEFGFACDLMIFKSPDKPEVPNLFARFGNLGPHFCFAGHLDVVPTGPTNNWRDSPFKGIIDNNILYGRGAVDMKGAVAAFICAALDQLNKGKVPGSLSILLTGDEEGEAIDGTKKVLEKLEQIGHVPDFCLVGEPTSEEKVGDTLKIGRRGSLTGEVIVGGIQGHVAYPHKAKNPIPQLLSFLNTLQAIKWDEGDHHFDPSNLEVVSVDVGNLTSNVIPGEAKALFNIRYNSHHTRESLIDSIEELASKHIDAYSLTFNTGSNPFFTHAPELVKRITRSIEKISAKRVNISTSGGTSDARFIHGYCPVLELGLLNQTAHQVDEKVSAQDLETLQKMYAQILEDFFAD